MDRYERCHITRHAPPWEVGQACGIKVFLPGKESLLSWQIKGNEKTYFASVKFYIKKRYCNMDKKSIENKNESIKLLLGMWIGGSYLQHLKLIQPVDAQDEDVAAVLGKIKTTYNRGINKGAQMTLDDQNRLLSELHKIGYEKKEMLSLTDEAHGADTEYRAAFARLLEQKRNKLLSEIDWTKKDGDKAAKQILETYTIDKVPTIKKPAVNSASKLIEECLKTEEIGAIPAGTKYLTSLTGGYRAGQLVSIGAGTGVGKSAFCLQIAEQAAKAGKKVLHFPLEMDDQEMAGRLIARATKGVIKAKDLYMISKLPPHKQEMLGDVVPKVDALLEENLLFIPFEHELSAIKKQVEIHEPDVVVIDQLSLVRDSDHEEENIRLMYKHICEELKFLATERKCVVILAVQSNREGTKKGSRPTMHNIKESASVEETSDACIMLHIPDEEQRNNPENQAADMEIYVDKWRQGQAGYSIKVVIDYPAQTIYDIADPRTFELFVGEIKKEQEAEEKEKQALKDLKMELEETK